MFTTAKSLSDLDREIARTYAELDTTPVMSDDYNTLLDRLAKLNKLKDNPQQISKDTLVLAATNLIGIAMIIRHEHVNVIASKAMNFAIKPR